MGNSATNNAVTSYTTFEAFCKQNGFKYMDIRPGKKYPDRKYLVVGKTQSLDRDSSACLSLTKDLVGATLKSIQKDWRTLLVYTDVKEMVDVDTADIIKVSFHKLVKATKTQNSATKIEWK